MEEIKSISEVNFPHAQEGDRVLYYDTWYVYINGTWIEETN